MSADNWAICPRCDKKRNIPTSSIYGKVSEEAYLEYIKKMKNPEPDETLYSLREDYELGIGMDGDFYVIYCGHCETCGFDFKYRYTQQLEI